MLLECVLISIPLSTIPHNLLVCGIVCIISTAVMASKKTSSVVYPITWMALILYNFFGLHSASWPAFLSDTIIFSTLIFATCRYSNKLLFLYIAACCISLPANQEKDWFQWSVSTWMFFILAVVSGEDITMGGKFFAMAPLVVRCNVWSILCFLGSLLLTTGKRIYDKQRVATAEPDIEKGSEFKLSD